MKRKIIISICLIIITASIVGALVLVRNKKLYIKDNKVDLGNALVIYYSGTNNTKRVAKTIANYIDGDLFEIEPVVKYTSEDLDYTNEESRVSKEHNDEKLRNIELKNTRINELDKYDIIFIGYPIWWGEAAYPVSSFVKLVDFKDKTIIPFATSQSSGLGESAKKLESISNSGNWQEGHRFESLAKESLIKDWLDNLKVKNK